MLNPLPPPHSRYQLLLLLLARFLSDLSVVDSQLASMLCHLAVIGTSASLQKCARLPTHGSSVGRLRSAC